MTINNVKLKELFCRCEGTNRFPFRTENCTKIIYVKINESGNVFTIINGRDSYSPDNDLAKTFPFYYGFDISTLSSCKTCKHGLRSMIGKCKVRHQYEEM